MKSYQSALALSLLLFSQCSFEPKYTIPAKEVPKEWKTQQEEEIGVPSVENWWDLFDDRLLSELEVYALKNNRNIFTAVQKVLEARAIVGIVSAELYPQINLQGQYYNTMSLNLLKLPAAVSTLPPPLSTLVAGLSGPYRAHTFLYALPLNLNYELDLFGRIRSQRNAAIHEWEAQEMALYTAWLILSTDLAIHYFQIRSFDAQLDLLKRTMDLRKESLEVNRERFQAGFINYMDVTRAETLFYNAESDFANMTRLRTIEENIIAVLLGVPASDFCIPYNPVYAPPPRVPAGIPSNVLKRRPDVADAERKVAAENSRIGAAYAAFFPTLSLTGTLGYSSPDLKDFLSWKSRLWAIGANANLPVFSGFRHVYNLEASFARFYQATGQYQQSVLMAFKEVEDALVSIQQFAEQRQALERSAFAAKETTAMARERYDRGLLSYLDVVESERTELLTSSGLIDLLSQQYVSTIQLIKAIGGSWEFEIQYPCNVTVEETVKDDCPPEN